MRAERWATAAGLALGLAIVPGALQLLPQRPSSVERPGVVVLGSVTPPPGPADEVAITPPGELVGALAQPVGPVPRFDPTQVEQVEGQVYALVIGIDDYPGSRADLGAAVADADTVDTALDGFGVPPGNRVVLRDGQARRADVVAAIQSLVQQGGPGSTLVLSYAGHVRKLGPGTEALVLADGGMISDAELAALLAPATTQRMWLLLATCYAGGFTELLAPGRVLTGAADANNLAYESRQLNASYLIHYLVREGWLQGAAGPSVQDAYSYADASLADQPRRRPVQLGETGSPIVLGSGDPTLEEWVAPSTEAPPTTATPSTGSTTLPPAPPPEEEDHCLLGVLCGG